MEWCSKPDDWSPADCRCNHELRCVIKNKEEQILVIECSSSNGKVHGVPLPFPHLVSPAKQLLYAWSFEKTQEFVKGKKLLLSKALDFGKYFEPDEGRAFTYSDLSDQYEEINYIVRGGLFVIILLLRETEGEYDVKEFDSGVSCTYRCSLSSLSNGEGFESDVDKQHIYISVCRDIHIFERGTGKFLRKWHLQENELLETVDNLHNLWTHDYRNKIAVSSTMDALFAITPEGVVEFSKEGVKKRLILENGMSKHGKEEYPIYMRDILLSPRIGLLIRDDHEYLWHLQ